MRAALCSEGAEAPGGLPATRPWTRDWRAKGLPPQLEDPQSSYWLGEPSHSEDVAAEGRDLLPLPQPSLPTAPSFPSSLPRAHTVKAYRSASALSNSEEPEVSQCSLSALQDCDQQLLSGFREEVASAKAWLTDWVRGLERSLSSHREALDKHCSLQSGDQGPLVDAAEPGGGEGISSSEDRLVERLTKALVGRRTSDGSGAPGQAPSPNPRPGRRNGAPQTVAFESCTPRSGPSSPLPGQSLALQSASQSKRVSNCSLDSQDLPLSTSRVTLAKSLLPQDDNWDDTLKNADHLPNETHAWALLSALGFRNTNTGLGTPTSPGSAIAGVHGSRKWLLKGLIYPRQFSSTTDKYIQMFSIGLVLVNTIYMGVHASMSLESINNGKELPDFFNDIDVAFAVLFLLELTVRVWVERLDFFRGPNARWNAFDTVLAVTPVVDILVATFNFSFLRSLKAFRAVRTARMIKAIHFVRDLRLMVASILCSLASLLWAFFLLAFVVYLFSIFLMQSIEVHAGDLGKRPSGALMDMYGSLPSSMYTLFCAISGGKDWADLVLPFDHIWAGYRFVFVGYVIFVSFGVLNILTAIFVESAKRIAEIDHEIVIQDQILRDKSTMNEIRRIFKASDEDLDGRLSRSELEKALKDEKTVKHLQVLELDINEVSGLFQLLDIDDQNTVVIDEFVIQLMRLKGGAKGLDLQTVLYENKRIFLRLTAMMRFVEKHLGIVETALQLHPGTAEGLTMLELIRNEEAVQKSGASAAY